jgi:hypothetical protein
MIFAVTAPPSSKLTMMLLGFDVPMDELLLLHGSQTTSDLRHIFQGQLHVNLAETSDEVL